MTGPSLLFRADTGPAVGWGHVMRCSALAEAAAQAGVRLTLITSDPEAPPLAGWRSLGARIEAGAGPAGSDEDAERLLAIASEAGAGGIVLDLYGTDEVFEARLSAAGLFTVFVDDLAERDRRCDLLVNPNIGADDRFADHYPSARRTRLGARYALIRPEIRTVARASGGGALVTLGGSDVAGKAAAIAADLKRRTASPVTLVADEPVAGARFATLPREALARGMGAADVVVCAGGVTMFEAACLGVPAVVLVLAQNQAPGAEALAAAGAVRLAATPDEATATAVRLLADPDARELLGACGRRLIDGQGADRIMTAVATGLIQRAVTAPAAGST